MHDDNLQCAKLGLGLTLLAVERYDAAAGVLEEAVQEHDDEVGAAASITRGGPPSHALGVASHNARI